MKSYISSLFFWCFSFLSSFGRQSYCDSRGNGGVSRLLELDSAWGWMGVVVNPRAETIEWASKEGDVIDGLWNKKYFSTSRL